MFGVFRTFLAVNVILLHIFNLPTIGNYSVFAFFTSYGVLQKGFKLELKVLPIYFILLIVFVFLLVKVIDEPVNKLRNKIKGNEN
jgi:hypothetical protein